MKPALLALALSALSLSAQASGLPELKAALQRLQGESPLKGQVRVKSENHMNEGKDDAETEIGQVGLPFEDGPQGLRLQFPQAVLEKALAEDQSRDTNPKASTPTATGLVELGYRQVRDMTRAGESLARQVQRSSFKGERTETWQGKPTKVLSFDLPQRNPNKYVKSFSQVLDVWVAADGTPLASRVKQTVSGRAMMVVSFESHATEEAQYAVVADRLVALKRSFAGGGSGMGERGRQQRQFALELSN
jgi:hypothetical protein